MAASKMQRQVSPIPPGRYWIVIVGPGNIEDFTHWVRDMAGAVRVEASSLDRRGRLSEQFVIFQVPAGRAPFLSAAQFGYPNFAGPEVTTKDDTASGPAIPLEPLEQAEAALKAARDAAAGAVPKIGVGAGLLLALALVLLLRR